MAWNLGWPDLTVHKRLQDNDVVAATIGRGTAGRTQFRLQLAPHLSWWKGVVLRDNSGRFMGEIWCQDSRRAAGPMTVNFRDIQVGAYIELWKAKAFGIHTHMYTLPDLSQLNGRAVTFRWSAD